ncbi:MAG: hypothetical protein ABI186_09665 [Candidatus Elarobacter sp.]
MNGRGDDVDALFERDADARLLERRRSELGLATPARPASTTPVSFGAESMLDEPPPAARPAALRVTLDARPAGELIPGAVVAVIATVFDDGETGVDDARLRVTLPADVEPIDGSFARGDIAVDGNVLLGEGLRLGGIAAGAAATVRFTLRVLPGTEPLDLLAFATAAGVPAIAGPTLRLRRRDGHAAFEAQRPFFELEPGERDEITTPAYPAAPAASAPPATPEPDAAPSRFVDAMIDEPLPPAPLDLRPRDIQPRDLPPRDIQPRDLPPRDIQPRDIPPRDVPPAVPESEPVRRTPERTTTLGRAIDGEETRALERVFAGALPHGLAALAVLSAIAATDGPLGDALGLGAFARSVSAALPHALVAARMNRPTPPVVTRAALDAIRPAGVAPDVPFERSGLVLVARLDARELDLLRAVLARDLADPFLRGVQLLLAVVPRALEGVTPAVAVQVRDALGAYRIAAGAWLMRVTVRRAVDKRYDPLTADDAMLHASGRALVATLRAAIP